LAAIPAADSGWLRRPLRVRTRKRIRNAADAVKKSWSADLLMLPLLEDSPLIFAGALPAKTQGGNKWHGFRQHYWRE
jgi:hypothetical protein